MKNSFITVEGNIGAGKTTLARMLASHYSARLVLEEFADNPFLPLFYKNPRQYAFPLELFFMAERYQQLKEVLSAPDIFVRNTVSDYLFIKSLLFAKINLSEEEITLYQRLFHIINPRLPQPDLLIYLHAPVSQLLENIKKRNRSYEQNISPGYLKRLQTIYLEFIRQQAPNVLLIDASSADFEHHPEVFQKITDAIAEKKEKGLTQLTL